MTEPNVIPSRRYWRVGRHAPEQERARPAERGRQDLAGEARPEREQGGEDGHGRQRASLSGSRAVRQVAAGGLTAASRLGSMSA